MGNYFKMKKSEWKLKSFIYGSMVSFIENNKEIADLANELFESLKDLTGEELRDKFVEKVAEFAVNKDGK